MTEETPKTAREQFKERAKIKSMDWLIGLGLTGMAGLMLLAFAPIRERAAAVWEGPLVQKQMSEDIQELGVRQQALRTEVRRLQQLDKVFEISVFRTRPIDGL